jgi:uncharacterized protein YkwD
MSVCKHPHRILIACALIGGSVGIPAAARADAFAVINSLRVKECANPLASKQQFMRNAKLAIAAQHVNDGLAIRDALKRADYRADQSAVIRIGGTLDDTAVKRTLAKNYCATLTDPGLVEVGIYSTPRELALVFAAPFAPPAPADSAKVAKQVLDLVNTARAHTRRCGNKQFQPVQPLVLNDRLLIAATAQAKDLASRGVVAHEGSDGSNPGDRVTRAGYAWKFVGENVAAGQLTAQEVVAGWLASPAHCDNIMDADFTQMAVAYAINTKQEIGIYWAQVFGRPQAGRSQ